MRVPRLVLLLILASSQVTWSARAEQPARITAADLRIDQLRAGASTYLVYMHGAAGSGIKRVMLASSEVKQERIDGADAWVIEHSWEDENGIVHTARSVHAARDLATLSQTSAWNWPGRTFTTDVTPSRGLGKVTGDLPPEARARIEAGFKAMRGEWWLNWHSDLALLPLLPFERGGTLRVRLFDVGMDAPIDVDYSVVGTRSLRAADGGTYECWLVETESGRPGTGNFQRFWIDKQRRIVIKEEDVIGDSYRSKVLLSVPATTEYALPPSRDATPAQ
jgi:hypothetical protein